MKSDSTGPALEDTCVLASMRPIERALIQNVFGTVAVSGFAISKPEFNQPFLKIELLWVVPVVFLRLLRRWKELCELF